MATSARASGLIREKPVRRLVLLAGTLAALAGFNHLLRNLYFISGDTGFDFRYVWLAGRMWIEGVDPYGNAYRSAGSMIASSGHMPELWAYPPAWWPIASILAMFKITTANLLWGLAGIALCFVSSFLVVSAFRWAYSGSANPRQLGNLLLSAGIALAPFHFFGTSALEATTLVIALGQTSLLINFGIALLLFGISRDSRPTCAIALSIILLKPHIGLAFALVFLFYNGWTRRALGWALALTFLCALPALIINPSAPVEMLSNVSRYDGLMRATLPQVTTGIRAVYWLVSGGDLGGAASALIVALTAIVTSVAIRRGHQGEDEMRVLWLCTTVATATTVALAPLHYYDFVIIACLMPALLVTSPRFTVVAILGAALIVRADTLGRFTGLYDHVVKVFEGTYLSTLGAALLLVAALGAASQLSFRKPTGAEVA